ncbi:MAG: hypothetical protein HYY50_00435 [Candidatus Kerfeldbacteria bacterium]|nr:hypothetical protein [Candidatus Kerfeldbacteria bacterium]
MTERYQGLLAEIQAELERRRAIHHPTRITSVELVGQQFVFTITEDSNRRQISVDFDQAQLVLVGMKSSGPPKPP